MRPRIILAGIILLVLAGIGWFIDMNVPTVGIGVVLVVLGLIMRRD